MITDLLGIVIGRHTHEPRIEGGGKVMYEIAIMLAQLGIETYLIGFNYYNRLAKYVNNESSERNLNLVNISTRLLPQNVVLNTEAGALAANLIESIKILNFLPKYKYELNKMKWRKVTKFIGNANKYTHKLLRMMERPVDVEEKRILVAFKKEELSPTRVRAIRPHTILVTSMENAYLAKNMYKDSIVVHAYPPIELSIYRPLKKERVCSGLFSMLGSDKLFLYFGRVNELRFPTQMLQYIVTVLKEVDKEAKLLIVALPDINSRRWLKNSLELVKKKHLDNVLILSRVLNVWEKVLLLNCSKAFVFPSIENTAIEPPITILEAVACGTSIITSGKSSSKEIAYMTNGYMFNDHLQLRKIFERILLSRSDDPNRARSFAVKYLSTDAFRKKLLHIVED